ncbi:glycerol-3-phosphate 1-O-acyltransferase PlsY [Novosphingobium sp.]|uniref:glycerol-3-phosphate 1-O-acyltransferase PlsY n=1 Tax=Novosphingobium sp. TaxID=1874826 RepID=UPI00286AF263|nr:glycerol-3-phosphate 1-O-acyltransferase PlsY [Novosphingobium sp.]
MESFYALALGYLLGSIPFGLILTNLFGEGNLRQIGSGNIGATNVLRTGNKGLAAATLLLDAGKGFLAVLIVRGFVDGCRIQDFLACWIGNQLYSALPNSVLHSLQHGPTSFYVPLAIIGVPLGHCFPVWLKFRGGKGVATMLGVGFGLDWRIGLIQVAVWLIAARITRVSSVGGMASAFSAPVAAAVLLSTMGDGLDVMIWLLLYIPALLTAALLVVWQHRENLARLRAGTEPRIGQKSK